MDLNLDIEQDVTIDPDALDVALVELPNLLFKYSELSTEAEREAKEAEEEVKMVRSRLVRYANENPDELEGKPTDKNVEAFYRTHPDHLEAKESQIAAEYKASIIKNAIFALYAKRSAIEHLIKLLSMDYFLAPSTPYDLSERVGLVREEARARVASSLKGVTPGARKKKTASKKTPVKRSKKRAHRN